MRGVMHCRISGFLSLAWWTNEFLCLQIRYLFGLDIFRLSVMLPTLNVTIANHKNFTPQTIRIQGQSIPINTSIKKLAARVCFPQNISSVLQSDIFHSPTTLIDITLIALSPIKSQDEYRETMTTTHDERVRKITNITKQTNNLMS